jgi:hypothetical protein
MTWQLNENIATGKVQLAGETTFEITLDASRPGPGIAAVKIGDQQLEGFWQEITGNLFASPPEIQELYVRGSDLICHYAEAGVSQLTPTIYWSLKTAKDHRAVILDIRIAVQTSTLGTQPETQVQWHWPHGKHRELALSESLIAQLNQKLAQPLPYLDPAVAENYRFGSIHLEGADVQVMPLVHLSDFAGEQFETSAESQLLTQNLSLPLLEKGVIRTARVRCLFTPSPLREETLLQQTLDYFQSLLPLTT